MGNAGSFKKGNVPGHPIQKGQHLAPATEFKAGQRPQNYLAVGTVTIREERNAPARRWIKIADPNQWLPYPQWLWLQMGGTIPEGFLVHHLDGDELNDSPYNLALITRQTHIITHQDELRDARANGRVDWIDVTCRSCGITFRGKYQKVNSKCTSCRKVTRRFWARARSNEKRLQNTS